MDDSLGDLLGLSDISEFFDCAWGKKTQVLQNCDLNVPFTLNDFEQLINFGNLAYPQVQCFSEDAETLAQSFNRREVASNTSLFVDPDRILELAYNKHTIRISDLSSVSKQLSTYSSGLQRLFGCNVHLNAYYSKGPSKGLPGHYDPHHIFVVQIYGEKNWNLGEVIISHPTTEFIPKPITEPAITDQIQLKSGDVMYLPPGAWHQTCTDDVSLHITVGIHPPRWENWLRLILKEATKRHPIFRAALPMKIIDNSRCEYIQDQNDGSLLLNFLLEELPELSALQPLWEWNPNSKVELPRVNEERSERRESVTHYISALLDTVWNLSDKPCSLYLRGSYARTDKIHPPWDIDIFYIIHDSEPLQESVQDICRDLEKKYTHLPRLDLTILSKTNFLFEEKNLLRRFLVVNDGMLIKGEDLATKIELPPLDSKTSTSIRNEMSRFAKKIIASFEWENMDLDGFNTNHFDLYTKSVAKALIRAGLWLGIQKDHVFARDIKSCQIQLKAEFPSCDSEIGVMIRRISGEHFALGEFLSAAIRLYNNIYR